MAIQFYKGLSSLYDVEVHGNGIFFATDTKEIIHNNTPFTGALADSALVKDVNLSEDGSKIVVTLTDGTTSEIEISGGKYASNIEDKTIAMTSSYGDFTSGTTVADLEGKTYDELFDGILFPTVVPTFTAPSATIKLASYSATQEVGAVAPTASNFTVSFSAGAITLSGSKQNDRAGAQDVDNSFIYWGGDASNTELPEVVALGTTSYKYRAAYAEGPQPKDNKGNDYSTPLASGYVDSSAVSVNGTYPWFASTSGASEDEPVVKQALIAWNATAGNMTTPKFELQPSGTLPQVFKLPRALKTLQMLNTVSGNMETIGTTAYTETTETIDINGNEVDYYVYTYNGSDRGSVTLIAKF